MGNGGRVAALCSDCRHPLQGAKHGGMVAATSSRNSASRRGRVRIEADNRTWRTRMTITLVAKLTAADGKADELRAALTEMVKQREGERSRARRPPIPSTRPTRSRTSSSSTNSIQMRPPGSAREDRPHGGDGRQAAGRRPPRGPPERRTLHPDRRRLTLFAP